MRSISIQPHDPGFGYRTRGKGYLFYMQRELLVLKEDMMKRNGLVQSGRKRTAAANKREGKESLRTRRGPLLSMNANSPIIHHTVAPSIYVKKILNRLEVSLDRTVYRGKETYTAHALPAHEALFRFCSRFQTIPIMKKRNKDDKKEKITPSFHAIALIYLHH